MLSAAVGIFHIITVNGGNDQGMGDDPRPDERRDLQQGFQDDFNVFTVILLLSPRGIDIFGQKGIAPVILDGRIRMNIPRRNHRTPYSDDNPVAEKKKKDSSSLSVLV
jgi:hypothetical protein